MRFRNTRTQAEQCEAYLRGIGAWGTDWYTDEEWEESWPKECEQLESGTEGVSWEGFEGILYVKYRRGQAQADLESCKRPQPEPEPDLGMVEPEPEPEPA